jgi:CRP-like cAMP-binding protein
VIIRQGHTAENFYFILSGKAIVKRAETNPVTGEAIIRTAAVMTKGMSFGVRMNTTDWPNAKCPSQGSG